MASSDNLGYRSRSQVVARRPAWLLREAGLDAVQADAFFPITSPACTALEIATVQQIRDRLLADGLTTEAEIEQHLANVAGGQLDLATAPLISAWGRKPQ
jgi:hypothetical protein